MVSDTKVARVRFNSLKQTKKSVRKVLAVFIPSYLPHLVHQIDARRLNDVILDDARLQATSLVNARL